MEADEQNLNISSFKFWVINLYTSNFDRPIWITTNEFCYFQVFRSYLDQPSEISFLNNKNETIVLKFCLQSMKFMLSFSRQLRNSRYINDKCRKSNSPNPKSRQQFDIPKSTKILFKNMKYLKGKPL
jgi:hypothetical protein